MTKETILAAIDRGDVDYLRTHCRTTKNTVNKLFANTRDSFATVEKNAAGKKRLVSATTRARHLSLRGRSHHGGRHRSSRHRASPPHALLRQGAWPER